MQQFLVIDMPRVEGCCWRLLYTKLNLPSSTLSRNYVVIKCLKDLDLEDTPPMNVDPDSLTKYQRHILQRLATLLSLVNSRGPYCSYTFQFIQKRPVGYVGYPINKNHNKISFNECILIKCGHNEDFYVELRAKRFCLRFLINFK